MKSNTKKLRKTTKHYLRVRRGGKTTFKDFLSRLTRKNRPVIPYHHTSTTSKTPPEDPEDRNPYRTPRPLLETPESPLQKPILKKTMPKSNRLYDLQSLDESRKIVEQVLLKNPKKNPFNKILHVRKRHEIYT